MGDETEMKVRRLLQEFEHRIVEINRRNMQDIIGEISEQDLLGLVEAVSHRRAVYLREVMQLAKGEAGDELIARRKDYREAMRGFDALRQALERGYFVLNSD